MEKDICGRRDISYHVIPHKLKARIYHPSSQTKQKANPQFDPESVHVCAKMSGEAAQFSKKEKFDSIVRFLSAR